MNKTTSFNCMDKCVLLMCSKGGRMELASSSSLESLDSSEFVGVGVDDWVKL